MILFCSMIAWGLTVSGFLTICYNWKTGITHLYQLHRVPCSKCQYFTNSCYLKCTINPHLACTEQAIGCRDFMSATTPQPATTFRAAKSHQFKYTLGDYHEH
jgi:hypothetical protein